MRQASRTGLNGEVCPVPVEMLGALYRSADIAAIAAAIPERTRARLAIYLYGRSHTHELGLQVAATCSVDEPHVVAGRRGHEIHALARKPRPQASQREGRLFAKSRISLGGGQGS